MISMDDGGTIQIIRPMLDIYGNNLINLTKGENISIIRHVKEKKKFKFDKKKNAYTTFT